MVRLLGSFKDGVLSVKPRDCLFDNSFAGCCEIYNSSVLKSKFKVSAPNDLELLVKVAKLKGFQALGYVNGSYSLVFSDRDYVYLVRDILGLSPLWYSLTDSLQFSSVRDDLKGSVYELNPRQILRYNIKSKSIDFLERKFFSITPLVGSQEHLVVKKLSVLFKEAVKVRIPNHKFGVCFSGGVDSTLIAFVCKSLGHDVSCYTSYFSAPGMKVSEDLVSAEKVSRVLGFDLKVSTLSFEGIEEVLKKIVPLIGPDPVKVGVALPVFASCQFARKDGCLSMFSGLGSEELFAGYLRHKSSSDLNAECLSGLKNMYERDAYRDYLVSDLSNLSIKTPFLDSSLVGYSLRLPPSFKLSDGIEKFIIRKVALKLGIPYDIAFRKKRAAQYGSNSDKVLAKLAKKNGFKFKKDYLKSFCED